MLPTTTNAYRFIQICMRSPLVQTNYIQCAKFSTTKLSKKEREAQLAEKYQPNTKLPKQIGQHANITIDELIYFPKFDQQLNPQLYASHLNDPLLNKTESNTQSNDTSKDISNVCIYHQKKAFMTNTFEVQHNLQLAIFATIALGLPTTIFYSMRQASEYGMPWTGLLTYEGGYYWSQSVIIAFLFGGFLIALRHQSISWIKLLKYKLFGTTSYISSISIIKPNILNIKYFNNTFFHKKQLSHNIELSTNQINKYFYLKPIINNITNTADVEIAMDLPDRNNNITPITIPMNGTVLNWETFITFIKDIPNPSGKFKPVQIDIDGYIPVCKYKDLLNCPRTTLDIYSHGIPPYKKKNTYLFVPNLKKDKLFVLYDQCKARNESLIHNSVFFEQKSETYLHCNSCYQSRNKNAMKPLQSCIEWKLDNENEDEDEAIVLIKLDASVIKNPLEFTDIYNQCALETFINFYCTNSFRLSHPNIPQNINDIFVLGELTQYPDWKDEQSPQITSVKSK